MNKRKFFSGNFLYGILALVVIWGGISLMTGGTTASTKTITTTQFIQELNKNNIDSVKMEVVDGATLVQGELKNEIEDTTSQPNTFTTFLTSSQSKIKSFKLYISNSSYMNEIIIKELIDKNVNYTQVQTDNSGALWGTLLLNFVPILLIGFFMFQTMGNIGSRNGPLSFGKVKSDDIKGVTSKVRFTDVAGADEEKQELVEVVEFLKNPKKFTELGARIPKGVLLEGPPGTGKTLLAKAVAGEANVPFHSISGSEFVEMFVGVGASRVRDLFEKARKSAPAIIFIDEIDTVGRRRGTGMGGGNDEREQTLNQLLVELDGFEDNAGAVIVIAATNRSDVLDPALLRPGRFDRQIMVGNPDVKAREAILKVHARNKKLDKSIDLATIAQKTPGFSGADLENLLNESALIAARRDKKVIDMSDVDEAQDRIIAGPAKENRERSEKSNKIVAYHEAGHAIAGLVLDDANEVHKVTIVPRGRAAGYVISIPKEDQVVLSKDELFQRVVGLLAGRTAEEIVFNASSTGASDDFRQATAIVRNMVIRYGMSEKLGLVQYEPEAAANAYGYQKQYSEKTGYEIDEEVRRITEEAHQKAKEILIEHREKLDLIAEKLIELETIDAKAIKSLFETGQMPSLKEKEDYPSEEAMSFDEAKNKLENKKIVNQLNETSENGN